MRLRSLVSGSPRVPLMVALVPLVAALTAGACSASSNSNVFGDGDGGGSNGTTSTAAGGGTGTGTGTGAGGGLEIDAGNQDADLDKDSACVSTSAAAQPIPLDMVILQDRSGSMSGTKWDGSTAALKAFVADPASAGINVGIVFFPIESPADSNTCNEKWYEKLLVDVGPLPANAPALTAAIDGQDATGGDTPMYGALEGALFNATALQDANPTHKVILVLATDGDPNDCPSSPIDQNAIPNIAKLAQSAVNYNGVQTFVIAIQGSTIANLNQIATAGGTQAAYDVTANIQQFSQKMADIRKAALACEFILPPPPNNEQLDPTKVNVQYTPGNAQLPQTLKKVSSIADCGASAGWYYDNDATPTKVILCPASCSTIQANAQAKVDVLFGCKTEIN